MTTPNRWVPSRAAKLASYDAEGTLHEFNLSRQATGGVGRYNSLFATEAEAFDSIAPHLAINRAKDVSRRNYVVQQGGATIYFEGPAVVVDPYTGHRTPHPFPNDRASFGHTRVGGSR